MSSDLEEASLLAIHFAFVGMDQMSPSQIPVRVADRWINCPYRRMVW